MEVRDVMTGRVVSIDPSATVLQAVRIMLQNRVSGLPVIDSNGTLIGIVTEGDLLRRAEISTERKRARWLEFLLGPGRMANEYVHTHGRKIVDVMTPNPHFVTEDTSLENVVQLMEKYQIKRLPVMRGKKIVGIVSRANLLHALASMAPTTPAPMSSDALIRERLSAELESQKWAPTGLLTIVVRQGVVDLWGTLTDEREREAFVVVAQNILGVKDVRDHLVWVEPMSGVALGPSGEALAP